VWYADQSQNGRVISPGYTDDPSGHPSGSLSQREEQPTHVIGDNVQASILLPIHFITALI